MHKQKFLIVAVSFILLPIFQNCQKASFSAGATDSASKLETGGTTLPSITVLPADDGSLPADGSVTPVSTSDDDNCDSGASTLPKHSSLPTPRPGNSEHSESADSASLTRVCILEGPGESVKLGISGGQNKVPQVMCMSDNGCRKIAAKLFAVKTSESRGYCKENGNPQVVRVTDSELQARIDAHTVR